MFGFVMAYAQLQFFPSYIAGINEEVMGPLHAFQYTCVYTAGFYSYLHQGTKVYSHLA